MTISTKQRTRTLHKNELFDSNGELTSEYTIFQLMIGKQQVSIGTLEKNGELAIKNLDNFFLGQLAVFLHVKM